MSSTILKIKKISQPIDLSDVEVIENMYEKKSIGDSYLFKPNECIFVVLNEKIKLPSNMVAHIRPRTSLSRLGIMINFQHINAGYEGILNIAMYNFSPNSYVLKPGMRIGQIVFEELSKGISEDILYTSLYITELTLCFGLDLLKSFLKLFLIDQTILQDKSIDLSLLKNYQKIM